MIVQWEGEVVQVEGCNEWERLYHRRTMMLVSCVCLVHVPMTPHIKVDKLSPATFYSGVKES